MTVTASTTSCSSILNGALSDVNEKYQLQKVIGRGTFGVVRKCQHRDTGEVYAVKTILKSKVPNLGILQREIEMLSEVDHPHIIRLKDVYEDETKLHLVTELCTGGELYDRVVEKAQSPEGHFSEYDAARIIRNILEAVAYCHDVKNIVHRDLKPENFLLLNERDDAPVKIIDFGLSRHSNSFGVMRSRVGTPYYVAPEVLTDDYTSKCDVWSIGVISYVLLCGYPPFYAPNEKKTLELVQQAKVEFPSPSWDGISSVAKRFVKLLLEKDPTKRPTASETLKEDWLQQQQVQPLGVSRRATFAPSKKNILVNQINGALSAGARPIPIRMKHNKKRTAFQKFLVMVKVKKAVKQTAAMM